MSKDTPYIVTQWDWFVTQLQLRLLWFNNNQFSIRIQDHEIRHSRPLKLLITHASTEKYVNADRADQLKFYSYLVEFAKDITNKVLDQFPNLKSGISFDEDIEIGILCAYGQGAYEICLFSGTQVIWHEPKNEHKHRSG